MTDWIDVNEKLPETMNEVAVLYNYIGLKSGLFCVGIGTYSSTLRVWFLPNDLREYEDVVIRYWLPLPEPPKQEDDDNES